MSSTNTGSSKDGPTPEHDSPSTVAAGTEPTVKKTVQTVEVRESAGQEKGQGVLKTIEVVHELPAKDQPAKQD